MRVGFLALVGLMACGPVTGKVDKGGDSGTPPGSTTAPGTPAGTPAGTPGGSTGTGVGTTDTGTSTTTGGATISASCAPTSNELRFLCDVTVDPAQPVDVHFSLAAGGPEYTFGSDDVANDHQVMLYMMKPDTVYDWRAVARNTPAAETTGQFQSGTVPAGCDVDPLITGTSTSPYFVVQSPCITGAYALVLDADGDVVWCDNFQPGPVDPMVEGITFTEDQTIMAVVADHIVEKDFHGNELLRLERGVDYGNHVHHDVFRKDGLTYVLFNESVNINTYDYDLDGFYVYQGQTLLAEWHLADHFTPANPPVGWPGRDYSHGNSVWVDDQGDLLMSLRHLSVVLSINADHLDPAFGTINWAISDPASEWVSDYVVNPPAVGLPGFQKQHNAHFLPTGELALFDNRTSVTEPSRLVQLELDDLTGEADFTGIYELPLHCDFQGGAWHTSSGNPVATCAPQRKAFEWDPGGVFPRWDMQLNCTNGLNTYVPRFIPWDGPWGP